MLIEFTVGNYRSFKEPVTFSMVAADLNATDDPANPASVFPVNSQLKLLKSAAIYGANASGKSNLARALKFMQWFMINSSRATQTTDKIKVEPFRLSLETENQPSFFEIVMIIDGKQYRYGFEVTSEQVISEWLFYVPKKQETELFNRVKDKIMMKKNLKADGIDKRTRHNSLFLSVAAQFNVAIAEKILQGFDENVHIISGLNDGNLSAYTVECLLSDINRQAIVNLIKTLDFNISNIQLKTFEQKDIHFPDGIPDFFKDYLFKDSGNQMVFVQTLHDKFDAGGNIIDQEKFDLLEQESEGTQKVFALSGLIVDVLKQGQTMIVDEFDARLHPLIGKAIIQLFNSPDTNPHNAQIILMTHDTNLLDSKLFRRDQIWFTEKNRYGATDLYSLAEYNVKNDAPFEQDYIKGRYGAIPFIGNLI